MPHEEEQGKSCVREIRMHSLVDEVKLRTCKARQGFTLIELLVVIAIIAILASLLFPALKSAKDMAKGIACIGNLRQSGLSLLNYTSDSNGYYPMENEISPPYRRWTHTLYIGKYINNWEMLVCPSFYPHGNLIKDPDTEWRNSYVTYGMGGLYNWNDYLCLNKAWNVSQTEVLLDSVDTNPPEWYYDYKLAPAGSFLQAHAIRKYRLDDPWKVHFRHKHKANVIFMDGHAEACSPDTQTTYKYYDPSSGMKTLRASYGILYGN